jgi:predicted RNase H-like HicB family nuclease
MKMTKKTIEKEERKVTNRINEILKLPYARILTPDADGRGYTAEVLEFPGCIAEGDTPQEAYANLEDTAKSWIETTLELGQDIPEPLTSQGFAGKIALRLPRSLHRRAMQMAERDGTSLNQFLLSAVSERVGATNLYALMMEQFAQQTARVMVSIKTTNFAIDQSVTQYIASSLQPLFLPEFIANIKTITQMQSGSLLPSHEGSQQHA